MSPTKIHLPRLEHICAAPLLMLALHHGAFAAEVEFDAAPETRIQLSAGVGQTDTLTSSEAERARVTIVREDKQYRWASRNNTPLVRIESGAYITYLAPSGAGYVRVLNPAMRALRASIPPDKREPEFAYLYVEHLVHQLGSVTYYGR